MLPVILAILAAAAVAAIVYFGRERIGWAAAGLTALRTIGLAALLLVLLNPASTTRTAGGPPTVLLDASLSMGAAGAHWGPARDTALFLGRGGSIFVFGEGMQPFDTATTPEFGTSRLGEALRAGTGRSGPVFVVTDGEIDDIHSIHPSLMSGVSIVTLPRDTVANAALIGVDMTEVLTQTDTANVEVTIGTWGDVRGAATVAVMIGDRLIHRENLSLPASPGQGRRRFALPVSSLPVGTSVLRFVLDAPDDGELRDNERLRVLTVTTQPGVVVVVDPADPAGRFLTRELREIVRTGVRGFARIADDDWIDMVDLSHVTPNEVTRVINQAALLVQRSAGDGERAQPSWYWPAGTVSETQFFDGDWYVSAEVPASPLAGQLASIAWDSLPPLTGIVPLVPTADQWSALNGRLGRRGSDRPLLIGQDSGGVRSLTTAGAGMWRWALRGGQSLDAYRAVLAAGIDWLLNSDDAPTRARITAGTSVSRGRPAIFRRRLVDVPDSITVSISSGDSVFSTPLVFDAAGEARLTLDPGVYRWSIPTMSGEAGVVAVEEYSDEFHPRAAGVSARVVEGGFSLIVRYAREHWWLFALAALALIGEWAWRQRIGLP